MEFVFIFGYRRDLRPCISARFLWRTDCPHRAAEKQHWPSIDDRECTTKRMTWTEWTIDSSGHVQLSTFTEKIIVLSSIYEYIPPSTGCDVVCILHGNPASLRPQARKFIFPWEVKRSYFLYRRATWLFPGERVFQLPSYTILCSNSISKIHWDFSFFLLFLFLVHLLCLNLVVASSTFVISIQEKYRQLSFFNLLRWYVSRTTRIFCSKLVTFSQF